MMFYSHGWVAVATPIASVKTEEGGEGWLMAGSKVKIHGVCVAKVWRAEQPVANPVAD